MRDFFRRSSRHADAGSALVEFVVISPLLMMLLIGLIEAGRIGDLALRVGNAARAGVQYGALNLGNAGDTTGMQNAAQNDAQSGVTAVASNFCQCADGTGTKTPASSCTTGTDCTANHIVDFVKVNATGTYTSGLNSQYLPSNLRLITISRTVIMRVAQ